MTTSVEWNQARLDRMQIVIVGEQLWARLGDIVTDIDFAALPFLRVYSLPSGRLTHPTNII